MNNITDVIAAISTPPGKGGVAVIRISGVGALDIGEKIFCAASKRPFSSIPARVQTYGYIEDCGERIDDVLLTKFISPSSYTGEDTVEICCHGGVLITRTVLESVLRAGARIAEAGEFTRRAYINGRLSLTEAEAIGTLLDSSTREELRLFSETSRTNLSRKIASLRQKLTTLMSSIYARIDYPDEDLGELSSEELLSSLYNIKEETESLLATYKTGRAIAEGIATAIVGKPNVGKSSIYNLILGEDAAIVTDIPGTTRDLLERTVSLGGVTLRLFDTAGIREAQKADAVEKIGIEKSRKAMDECELLFAIFDLSRPFDKEDEELIAEIKEKKCTKIAIFNKTDKPPLFDRSRLEGLFDAALEISAKESANDARASLSKLTGTLYLDENIKLGETAIIASARQNAALERTRDFICYAIASLEEGFEQDAASSDIERALSSIGELDGRTCAEAVVADIFSRFCVGK